jgi:predicted ABC-type ATPase
MPSLYVIAGPNGAGKTTFIKRFAPSEFRLLDFLNADEIARGLSPFDPARAQFEAGRLVLTRFDSFINEGRDFCLETTLSGKTYRHHFQRAREMGYTIRLDFLYLLRVEESIQRVAQRVEHGGHDVPREHLLRRFKLGLQNLFRIYRPLLDVWAVYRNDVQPPVLVARGAQTELRVVSPGEFAKLSTAFDLQP